MYQALCCRCKGKSLIFKSIVNFVVKNILQPPQRGSRKMYMNTNVLNLQKFQTQFINVRSTCNVLEPITNYSTKLIKIELQKHYFCDRLLKKILHYIQFLYLISCFNFNDKSIYSIKVVSNITNYVMLFVVFHDIRFFRSYTSNISLSSALN